ncbi:MAG: Sapep family Mn(2+)-dependent dipeptidase [Lachnospiraceae bacterium]|nr:Sapep family Mn(2+)-dependent dipeptidase [Lachnospiraceae bacterium]
MDSYREKIDAYIDGKKEEMLEDLKTLVRINSQKGTAEEGKPFGAGPAAAVAAAQELMQNYGLAVRNYENYVVTGDLFATSADAASDDRASAETGCISGEEKGLDILAHLDVVPVTEDWTVTQPFEPKVVDGRIYGRGTSDDKGPAIAALYALRAIRELGIPMKKGVRLVLGSDEECGSSDLAYYYGIEKEAPYTFTPDAEFPVINIEKGRLAASFHGEFSDGRSETKSEGITAPGNEGTLRNMQISPRVLRLKSGDKANVVPGRAVLELAGLEEAAVRFAAEETAKETGVVFEISSFPETIKADDSRIGTDSVSQTGEAAGNIFKIDARGAAAHASTPQEGKNALTASLRLVSKLFGGLFRETGLDAGTAALLALERLFPYEDTCGRTAGVYREDANSGAVTLCFSVLDYTPGHLSGTFDARLPIGCTEENTRQPLMEALAAAGLEMEDAPMSKPHCVPGDSEFVKILLDSYERYFGVKGEPLSTGGGTYVHGLERGVAFGCGTPDVDNHMHGDDEFMVIDTLVMSAKIFADAAIRICNEL